VDFFEKTLPPPLALTAFGTLRFCVILCCPMLSDIYVILVKDE